MHYYRYILLFVLPVLTSVQAQREVYPYPDNSLDMDQYASIGIPDMNRNWKPVDFETVFAILDELYAEDKTALPRADSPYSGELFTQLASADNFLAQPDLARRLFLLESAQDIPRRLLLYYLEPEHQTERFGAEVLSLRLLDYQIQSALARHYDQLLLDHPTAFQHARVTQKISHLHQRRDRSLEILLRILEEEATRYAPVAVVEFLNKLYFLLPDEIDEAQRARVRQRLFPLESNFPYATARPIISELRLVLKG